MNKPSLSGIDEGRRRVVLECGEGKCVVRRRSYEEAKEVKEAKETAPPGCFAQRVWNCLKRGEIAFCPVQKSA
jgi:hypothetical protein